MRIVTSGVWARGDRNWALNEGQIPNFRGVRVALGTGFTRGEGDWRAARNARVSHLPPEIPTIRDFFLHCTPRMQLRSSPTRIPRSSRESHTHSMRVEPYPSSGGGGGGGAAVGFVASRVRRVSGRASWRVPTSSTVPPPAASASGSPPFDPSSGGRRQHSSDVTTCPREPRAQASQVLLQLPRRKVLSGLGLG
jgi:hypothetical protein